MGFETKFLGSTVRDTSQGMQVVQFYRAQETSGTVLAGYNGDAPSLARIVNADIANDGPPIPTRGSDRDFNVYEDGTAIQLECVEVIARLENCNRVKFQCRFSNFPYWSGINNPTSPDPRVVFLTTGRQVVDTVPKFERIVVEAEGGSETQLVWAETRRIPVYSNTGQLRVRVYLPDGMTDANAQTIYRKIGQIHLISGEKWRFEGANISETSGGLVSGDPVFVTYSWTGENNTAEQFADDSEVVTIPEREPFYRYEWTRDRSDPSKKPMITTYLPDSGIELPETPEDDGGWAGLPGDPIIPGGTPIG